MKNIGKVLSVGPFKVKYYQALYDDRYIELECSWFKKSIKARDLPGGSFQSFAAKIRDWIDETIKAEEELDEEQCEDLGG